MKISAADNILRQEYLHPSLTETSDSLPPYLMASFEQSRRWSAPYLDAVLSFEYLSLSARIHAFYDDHTSFPWLTRQPMRTLTADCVKELIEKRVRENYNRGEQERVSSVKFIGFRIIEGDLDLSKMELDFSIRFIGCWIEGALLLDRARLETLDLSGSVIQKGISANYLQTRGAVRLRRTVFTGPADFGGATIGATLDLTDAVLMPRHLPPPSVSFTGDRGILNLSLATIASDFRCLRMRLYGGANLRGASIGGSFFLNDALFRSPMACVERYLTMVSREEPKDGALISLLNADNDLAELHWVKPSDENDSDKFEIERNVELLEGSWLDDRAFITDNSVRLLNKLCFESSRSTDCALKAEAAEISGSVIARGCRFAGRVRMKQIMIKGSLSFSGSRFKTPRATKAQVERLIETTSLIIFRHAFLSAKSILDKREVSDRNEFALDLQLADISGSLELENDGRHPERQAGKSELTRELVGKLCQTKENPVKFFSIFNCSTGDPYLQYRAILEQKVKGEELSDRQEKTLHLYEALLKCATISEPAYYKRERIRQKTRLFRLIELEIEEAGDSSENFPKEISVLLNRLHLVLWKDLTNRQRSILLCFAELCQGNENPDRDLSDFSEYNSSAESDLVLDDELPAQPEGFYTNSLINQLCCDCITHGNINATIINGEICLAEAKIGGSARFTGLVANAFGSDESDKTVISLRNTQIEGDCDFRDSIGVNSINAQQAKIGGSIRFADEPVFGSGRSRGVLSDDSDIGVENKDQRLYFDPAKDEWSPVRRRAIFLVKRLDTNEESDRPLVNKDYLQLGRVDESRIRSIGKYSFERAQFGGNASFVFDPKAGPALDLAYTTTRGKLSILPSTGGIDMTHDEYVHLVSPPTDPSKVPAIRRPELIYRGVASKTSTSSGKTRPPYFLTRWIARFARGFGSMSLRMRASFEIFRNNLLTVGELVRSNPHGPGDRLEQETISNIGDFVSSTAPIIDLRNAKCSVLAHPPSAWPETEHLIVERLRYDQTRGMGPLVPFRRTVKELLQDKRYNATAYMRVLALLFLYIATSSVFLGANWNTVSVNIGRFNAIAGAVLTGVVVLVWAMRSFTRPLAYRGYPLALKWLSLQRRNLNPRKVQSAFHPLEPYALAAATLRSAGRLRSAEKVELYRLRRRASYVSKRSGFPLAILLWLTDSVIEYGYAPFRAALIAAGIIITGSGIGHYSAEKGQVIAADYDLLRASGGADEKVVTSKERDKLQRYPEFNSMAYTLDIFVPFLDLQQDSRWIVAPPAANANHGGNWLQKFMRAYAFWWRVLGWIFTTIIAIAIVARVETIVARNEES